MLEPLTGNRGRSTLLCVTCLATAVACGPGSPPELTGLSDQVAQVGTELMVNLHGSDPDGDDLAYEFHTDAALDGRAEITTSPGGTGVFRWTPSAADVGEHAVDFTVADAAHRTSASIRIDVRSAIGAATAPVFRQPLGSGTTLDLSQQACVDVDIVIDDADSSTVRITQGDPVIEGSTLDVRDGHMATWHWCPTREQQAEPRHTLTLAADDGDNPRTVKNFLVVLRGSSGTTCPGGAPVIAHTPHDVSSIVDLAIEATISDDKGIKDAPLFYYATTMPATPPDVAHMTQLTMRSTGGDPSNGTYAISVPNPVAEAAAGTRQTLYYVFVAGDNDDTAGTCNHTTTSPVYQMTVTSTGAANLPLCAACTSDAQCGAGDECVRMGASGASYCLQACGAACPTGTTCSAMPVTSVDGASAPQCVPDSGTCEMMTTSCSDDSWEVNDTQSDASHNPALEAGPHDLISCPSTSNTTRANDDWFKLVVTGDKRVDVQLAGGPVTDLDLRLYRSNGALITGSTGLDADEAITACLPAATYYLKVNGYGSARNPYTLTYTSRAESCSAACVDDAREGDDAAATARETTYPDYSSAGNQICPDDDDWYLVPLFTGETMVVDLTFTQSSSTQDLDIHLYRNGTDLTPCDVSDPLLCSVDNGQSASSNEHTEFTAPAGCTLGCDYHVVVRGFNHSANAYRIDIAVE